MMTAALAVYATLVVCATKVLQQQASTTQRHIDPEACAHKKLCEIRVFV